MSTPYAVYPSLDDALRALVDLRRAGVPGDRISILDRWHRNVDESQVRELPIPSTDQRRATGFGLLLGGLVGTTLGIAGAALDAVSLHWLAAAALGGFGGAFFGAIGGLLYGSGQAEPELTRAAASLRPGEALLAIRLDQGEGPDPEQVEEILAAHGGARLPRRHEPAYQPR